MILDDPAIEIAYVVLVIVAWSWALSQVRYAWMQGDAWRWITAYWLVAKAVFLSVAATVWWTNTLDDGVFRFALYNFVGAHLVAFIKWLTLPKSTVLAPEPPAEPKEQTP